MKGNILCLIVFGLFSSIGLTQELDLSKAKKITAYKLEAFGEFTDGLMFQGECIIPINHLVSAYDSMKVFNYSIDDSQGWYQTAYQDYSDVIAQWKNCELNEKGYVVRKELTNAKSVVFEYDSNFRIISKQYVDFFGYKSNLIRFAYQSNYSKMYKIYENHPADTAVYFLFDEQNRVVRKEKLYDYMKVVVHQTYQENGLVSFVKFQIITYPEGNSNPISNESSYSYHYLYNDQGDWVTLYLTKEGQKQADCQIKRILK